MKKINTIFLIILILALVALALYLYLRDSSGEGELVDEGLVGAVCQRTETNEDITEDYTIKTEVCRTGIPDIDSEIDSWLNERATYTKENAEALKGLGSAANTELLVSSETFTYSDEIKSLRLVVYEYQGGAHGMTDYKTWVFNKETGEILGLQSFFREYRNPLIAIYPVVKEKLMAKSEDMEESWVDRGTGEENFENYKNFVLDGNKIIFTFPAYQVGPYALGPQEVSIAFTELSTSLKPEFFEPAAMCRLNSIDACPEGCIVCPPCEACSSLGCDLADFCYSIGFDADWYEMIKAQRETTE